MRVAYLVPAAAALASLAGLCCAQSVSVDFDRPTGVGAGAPSAAFAGASSLAGVWNSVQPVSSAGGATASLLSTLGAPTNVTLTHHASHGWFQSTYGAGDFSKLMADGAYAAGPDGLIQLDFNNITPGFYRIYAYAALPPGLAYYTNGQGSQVAHFNQISVRVGAASVGFQVIEGSNGGTVESGVNVAAFNAAIPAGSPTLQIDVWGDLSNPSCRAGLAGVQIRKWPSSRVYVRPGGSGDASGTHWTNAMSSVQAALNLARNSGGFITEVWVASGTYKPTNGTDRAVSFELANNVALRGGFAGTESELSERQLGANVSYLSGDLGVQRVTDDNSYHVVRATQVDRTAVLDGFTIIGGNADGSGGAASNGYGGGLYATDSAPTIRNCVFWSNSALATGGGAAVFTPGTGLATLIDRCVFRSNVCTGAVGGGLAIVGPASGTLPLVNLASSAFYGNRATQYGGGVYVRNASLIARNSLFSGNRAFEEQGGGVWAGASAGAPFLRVENCTLASNEAHASGGVGVSGMSASIRNSILWQNTAASGSLREKQLAGATVAADYSLIQGLLPAENLGAGNLASDPQFTDRDGADNLLGTIDDLLTLADLSPAVDAGSNALAPVDVGDLDGDGSTLEPAPFDLLGLPRVVDGLRADSGAGAAPLIDMGAYESQTQAFCPADFNHDGFLDFFDYDDFVTAFETGLPGADFNGDAFIDFFDYDDFVTAFTLGC